MFASIRFFSDKLSQKVCCEILTILLLKQKLHSVNFSKDYLPFRSSTCALTGFFWLLSHVIYLKLNKRITRVSSFPSFNFWMIDYSYTQKSYLVIWQNCFGHFITQKFASLKSKQLTQFFLVRGKSKRIDKIHFAESSGLRPERQKKKFHYSSLSLEKKTLL